MGIAFITEKAKKFKHQKDAAYEDQMASENLLSRLPDRVQSLFRCSSIDGTLPELTTSVLLYKQNECINVFVKNKQIGTVIATDARELTQLMTNAKTEMMSGHVVEIQPVSKTFLVQLG